MEHHPRRRGGCLIMGRALKTRCKDCGDERRYHTGFGRMPIKDVRKYIFHQSDPADRRELQIIDREHSIDWSNVSCSRGIRKCPRCKLLYSFFSCRLSYAEGRTFESLCECELCIEPTVPFDYDYDTVKCYKCFKPRLEPIGMAYTD